MYEIHPGDDHRRKIIESCQAEDPYYAKLEGQGTAARLSVAFTLGDIVYGILRDPKLPLGHAVFVLKGIEHIAGVKASGEPKRVRSTFVGTMRSVEEASALSQTYGDLSHAAA